MSQSKKKAGKEKPNIQQPKQLDKLTEEVSLSASDFLLTDKQQKVILPLITFLIAISAYLLTFARTVTLVDSGELILTSAKLGVAHPPGFPLYTILGYLFTKLPFGSIAARMSFMSAFFAALTSAVLTLITINIYDVFAQNSPTKQGKKTNVEKQSLNSNLFFQPIFKLLMPLIVALSFSFSTTLWFYASVAEVYTLNIFMLSVIIYLMLEWHLKKQTNDKKADKIIPIAALIYGLALGVHHVTILLTLPAIAFFVIYNEGFKYLLSKQVKIAFVTVLIGFAIYLYLPISASQQPIFNWGNPSSLERFYWHISAKQYQVNLSPSLEIVKDQFKYFANLTFWQFTPLGLVFIFVGLAALWKNKRNIFYLTILVIVFDLAYSVSYEIAEDKDAYYLTTNFALTIIIAAGLIDLFTRLAVKSKPFATLTLIFFSILPILNFATHYQENNKKNYLIARDYVENVMRSVEPNSLLLTLEWQFYSPYLYMCHLENFRPDAIVVDVNLLRRSWYIEGYLTQQYPDMMKACEKETKEFLEDLRLFEADKPYDNVSISKKFFALINSFINYNLSKNQAAYTMLPIDPPTVVADYNLVPQGLTMRIYADKTFHLDPAPSLELRGLLDGTTYLDEVATKKLLPNYATMIANRGKYLSVAQRHDEAIEFLQLSLKLLPNFDRTYQFLGDAYAGKGEKAIAEQNYRKALELNPDNKLAQQSLQKLNQLPN